MDVDAQKVSPFEVLSRVGESEFPEEWYDHTDESHFWVKWRISAFFKQLAALNVSTQTMSRGLDIGCAHGVVMRQIEEKTAWEIDGCDLNRVALERSCQRRGHSYLYDIHDRRDEFREAYDFLILFDVIEHIEDTKPFLDSAIYHLKPEGLLFVNVPAAQWLYSRYDRAAGHFRRYDKAGLRRELEASGVFVLDMRYWGLSLIPLLILRKALLIFKKGENDEIIRFGFKPPSTLLSNLLTRLMEVETTLLPSTPLGTSLLAVARRAS